MIETTSDISATSYVDHDVTIGVEYHYQIAQYIGNNIEFMSNVETGIFEGDYFDIGTDLDMMHHDPNSAMIYGLDTDNNSLVFIDTEQEQVVNSIFVGSTPTDMDFSLDNELLYVANSGGTEISVVDLASQSVQSSFFVEMAPSIYEGFPYTLAVMANGRLAYASEDSFNEIELVDLGSGELVYTNDETIYTPYLIASSDGTNLFASENGSSSRLFRFELIDNELVLQESSVDLSGGNSRQAFITDDDQFVFHANRKHLASNVSGVLGSFDGDVYAINSDGSRALGEEEIYNGFNFNTIGILPLSTNVSVFGNDNTTAYLFQKESQRLYKVTVE